MCSECSELRIMVFAGEAMIFVVDSDEAVGQCDDEDMRKLEALAANKADEPSNKTQEQTENETNEHEPKQGTAQTKNSKKGLDIQMI